MRAGMFLFQLPPSHLKEESSRSPTNTSQIVIWVLYHFNGRPLDDAKAGADGFTQHGVFGKVPPECQFFELEVEMDIYLCSKFASIHRGIGVRSY